MINTSSFYKQMQQAGVGIFTGVPDSLLSSLSAYIMDHTPSNNHIITANEGNAIALAAGYHLSTGGIGAVYMQNSGFGNTINPLTSLTDAEVYRIPMLLIIGWRGEPGIKDEPQHVKQGRITTELLELLEIPYQILDADSDSGVVIKQAMADIASTNAPVALLVRKNTFTPYKNKQTFNNAAATLSREDALRKLLSLTESALVVSTTGKTSREVFELRIERGDDQRDFLTVGAMGHTASIAMGVALGCPHKTVVCIDGDGSVLMHMGALPIAGGIGLTNFIHVLINNAAHESVGGQPTVADKVDFKAIAKASGYTNYAFANNLQSLQEAWINITETPGPGFLEVAVKIGSRSDLGRPTSTPQENKQAFIKAVNA